MEHSEKLDQYRRPTEPILIVEDHPDNRLLLRGMCESLHLQTDVAENGMEALKKVRNHEYSLFIVDLMMPVMDGRTFIGELKKILPEAVILVQTALDSPETIIDIMKLDVFDYLIKPIDLDLFQRTVGKGLELKYLREMEHTAIINAGRKLAGQLEWLNYKEIVRTADRESRIKSYIHDLKTSLSQGSGLGSLVTLIELIQMNAAVKDDKMIINKKLGEELFRYNETNRQMLEGLVRISNVVSSTIELSPSTASTLISTISDGINALSARLPGTRPLKTTLPQLKQNCNLNINLPLLLSVMQELVFNAWNYGKKGGAVNVFSFFSKGYFCLTVKNDRGQIGVPKEYEKLILEPFFRLQPPLDSIVGAGDLSLGLGIGLTVVENVVRKHGGLFFIYDSRDHTGNEVRDCILAEVHLPIVD